MPTSNHPPANDDLASYRQLAIEQIYWMATYRFIQRGLDYFADERIRHIEWDSEENHFLADVSGTALYTSKIWLRNGRIGHQCNCPAHSEYGVCKHVVATAVAALYLTTEKSIGRKPNQQYLVELKQTFQRQLQEDGQLAAIPHLNIESNKKKAKRSRPRAELRLVTNEYDLPGLEIHGTLPGEFFRIIGTYPSHQYGYYNTIPLSYADPVGELLDIIEQAQKFGISVIFRTEKKRRIEVLPEIHPYANQLIFDFDGKEHIQAFVQIPDERGQPLSVITRLDEGKYLLNDGTLAETDDNPSSEIIRKISNFRYQLNELDNTFDYTVDDFNEQSLAHHFPKKCFDPNNIEFQLKGTSRPPLSWKDKEHPADPITLSIRVVSNDEYNCTGRLVMRCGPHELPMDAIFAHFGDFMRATHPDSRLMNAKTRIRLITRACIQLHLLEKAEQDAFIEDVCQDKCFDLLNLSQTARSFLKKYKRTWVDVSAAKKERLVVVPGSDTPWQFVSIPLDALAHLSLCMFMPESKEDLMALGSYFRLPKIEVASFVERVGLAANIWGVPLYLDDKPIDRAPVTITVDVAEQSEIDWFELKAEIRCGELTIPQDYWEELIRGNLLLEKDGKAVLVEIDSKDAIQRLQALLTPVRKKRGAKSKADTVIESVPKLKILDWIALRKMGITVNLPESVEKIFESLTNFQEIDSRALPKYLDATPREYQQTGYEWLAFLYEHRFGACLADDMGLGKTLQAILFLAAIKEGIIQSDKNNPHLIVVPPSLVFNWHQEIERFYPKLTVAEYLGNDRDLKTVLHAEVVLTTYDIVRRDIEQFEKQTFDVVVFDETQILKNIIAERTKAALKLKRRFTLCITGTPMENHIGEYYSILNLALPGLLGDYKTFRTSMRNGETAALERTHPFILRRTKERILKELPQKQEQDIYLEMSDIQKEIYTRTVGEVREEVLAAFKDKTNAQAGIIALTALTRLRQVCVGTELLGQSAEGLAPKFEFLTEKLLELQEENHCALVFSQFTRALDYLEAAAKDADLPYLRMDGKTPTLKRKQIVEDFQNTEKPKFFFISLKTGGFGLNLTRANYVFHLDPWWNPAVENQASDRVHRIGQKQTVFIQRLLMRESIEEKMMELKRRKQKLFDQIVDPAQAKADKSSAITPEDLQFLLDT